MMDLLLHKADLLTMNDYGGTKTTKITASFSHLNVNSKLWPWISQLTVAELDVDCILIQSIHLKRTVISVNTLTRQTHTLKPHRPFFPSTYTLCHSVKFLLIIVFNLQTGLPGRIPTSKASSQLEYNPLLTNAAHATVVDRPLP